MSKGKKFDQDKPDMSLMSSKAFIAIMEVMTDGKKKYGRNNWRKGLEWSRVFAAVQRHLLAWNDGETYDKESGLNHLAHAGCGIMFLLEYSKTHPELDDRYKPSTKLKQVIDVKQPDNYNPLDSHTPPLAEPKNCWGNIDASKIEKKHSCT